MKRYLQSLCYDLNCNRPLLSVTFESSSNLTELSIINEPKELHDYVVNQPKWIKFGHLLLKKSAYLYLDKGDYYPNFGKIVNLYLLKCANGKQYALCIQNYDTLYFDSHFNGYVIEPMSPPSYIALNVKSLKSYPVLHAHKSFNNTSETFIVLKQDIV